MRSIEPSLKLLDSLLTKEKKKFKGEEVERYSSRDNRQLKLLKSPEETNHEKNEWFIYVPTYFNECLDISKTDRVVKTGRQIVDEKTGKTKDEKKTIKEWTQGSRFSFHRGCTLYDTPKAYQEWSAAIRKTKYCISIEDSMDARPAMNFDDRFPGEVEFSVYTPSSKQDKLQEIGTFTLSQDEFVRFLIKGNPEIIPNQVGLF